MDHGSAATDEPWICPFLRARSVDGTLDDPIGRPDESNRCIALGDGAPQSLRQQEYACLASAHVNCPRFIRGASLIAEVPPVGAGLQLTPAVVGALLVLAASFALSVGFVLANGGMNLPVAPTGSPIAAVASASPSQGSQPSVAGSPSAEPTGTAGIGSATATPTGTEPPAVSPSSDTSPTPAVTDEPTASASPSPRPSSDRYALLEPCPDEPDCWFYTIRTGDNLVSIARYFGVPLAAVTERNPWTETTQLVAGQELLLPPPTR